MKGNKEKKVLIVWKKRGDSKGFIETKIKNNKKYNKIIGKIHPAVKLGWGARGVEQLYCQMEVVDWFCSSLLAVRDPRIE